MKTLLELDDNDCRFPFGEETFLFCGDPKQDKSSYCSHHHAICFRTIIEALRGGDNPHAGAAMRKMWSSTQSTLSHEPAA